MVEMFALSWFQHGMWVSGEGAIMGRPALANALSQVAMLPGAATIEVEQIHEENAADYGLNPEDFDGTNYLGI